MNGACRRTSDEPKLTAPRPDLTATPGAPPGQTVRLSQELASGTSIPVELRTVLDSSLASGFVLGVLAEDVMGGNGGVAIPAGSAVTMLIRKMGKTGAISVLDLGLYSVNIAGQQYGLSDGETDAAILHFTEDAGNGPAHRAVHLQYGRRLEFKLEHAVALK